MKCLINEVVAENDTDPHPVMHLPKRIPDDYQDEPRQSHPGPKDPPPLPRPPSPEPGTGQDHEQGS